MITFQDIFKKSFLEGYSNIELSAKQIVVVMFFAVLLGVYIYAILQIFDQEDFLFQEF